MASWWLIRRIAAHTTAAPARMELVWCNAMRVSISIVYFQFAEWITASVEKFPIKMKRKLLPDCATVFMALNYLTSYTAICTTPVSRD